MKVSDILARKGRAFASLEIVPPLKGVTREELLSSIEPFIEFNPPYINVTSHRDEYVFVPRPDGSFERRVDRSRMSETAVCAAIKSRYPDIEVVPHLICAGASRDAISAKLSDFDFLGIRNVMALRGDCRLGEKRFKPHPEGYVYASEMVGAIRSSGLDFCIGVGAYPEKHFEAPNLETDISNLKKKVDEGADYIITQMFFDNSVFYSFRDKCRSEGIDIPIIPGLKPISRATQIDLLPQSFSIDLPQDLVSEIRKNPGQSYSIGLEWCSSQVRDLLAHGVPAVHFYTMGRPDNVLEILKNQF